ncbi:hypothetical protein ACWC9T_30810 [Kitasatospora sp. NPDC001159]
MPVLSAIASNASPATASRRLAAGTWLNLPVFRGGFDLEAAEAACAREGRTGQGLLSCLAAPADRSVLTRDNHCGGAPDKASST